MRCLVRACFFFAIFFVVISLGISLGHAQQTEEDRILQQMQQLLTTMMNAAQNEQADLTPYVRQMIQLYDRLERSSADPMMKDMARQIRQNMESIMNSTIESRPATSSRAPRNAGGPKRADQLLQEESSRPTTGKFPDEPKGSGKEQALRRLREGQNGEAAGQSESPKAQALQNPGSGAHWRPERVMLKEGNIGAKVILENAQVKDLAFIMVFWLRTEQRRFDQRAVLAVSAGNGTDACMLRLNGNFYIDGQIVKAIDLGAGPTVRPHEVWDSKPFEIPLPKSFRLLEFATNNGEAYLFDCQDQALQRLRVGQNGAAAGQGESPKAQALRRLMEGQDKGGNENPGGPSARLPGGGSGDSYADAKGKECSPAIQFVRAFNEILLATKIVFRVQEPTVGYKRDIEFKYRVWYSDGFNVHHGAVVGEPGLGTQGTTVEFIDEIATHVVGVSLGSNGRPGRITKVEVDEVRCYAYPQGRPRSRPGVK